MRLGVNIDHVATLREARKTFEPSPLEAALLAQRAGADQITFHLREDRRHIKDKDVFLLKELITIPLNMEMAPIEEMREIAIKTKVNRVTLVPEKREEITTEGGLDVLSNINYLKSFIKPFKENNIEVSLFIDPDKTQIESSKDVGADAIELHTGSFSNYFNEKDKLNYLKELEKIKDSALFAKEFGLNVYAGHGLNYHSVKLIKKIDLIEELNIGHSIIARAVFVGIERAIKEMVELLR